MKHLLKSTLTIAALAIAATLGRSESVAAAQGDQAFVTAAGQGGMAEVAQAKLALQDTRNATADTFAERMIKDHTKMNTQLMAIVKMEKYMAPQGVGAKNAAMSAKLDSLSGQAFATAYLQGQMPAHQQTLMLLMHEAQSGTDPKLVAFAKAGIPVVKMHIAMLKKDMSMMAGSKASSM